MTDRIVEQWWRTWLLPLMSTTRQTRTIMMMYLMYAHNVGDVQNRTTMMTYPIPAHNVHDGQTRTIMMTYLIPAPSRVPHDVDDGWEAGSAGVGGVVSLLHEVVVFPSYLHRYRLGHAKYQLGAVGESGLCDSICISWGRLDWVDLWQYLHQRGDIGESKFVTLSASTGVGESGLCDSICTSWGMLERADCVTVSAS